MVSCDHTMIYLSIRSYLQIGIPSFYITASDHIARWAFHHCISQHQIILPDGHSIDVIFEKFKGPCGHDNPSFGAFAPNHFCRISLCVQLPIFVRNHLLRKQQNDFLKTCPKGRFSMLFGHNYFLNSAIRNFRRFSHTNSARRISLKG